MVLSPALLPGAAYAQTLRPQSATEPELAKARTVVGLPPEWPTPAVPCRQVSHHLEASRVSGCGEGAEENFRVQVQGRHAVDALGSALQAIPRHPSSQTSFVLETNPALLGSHLR